EDRPSDIDPEILVKVLLGDLLQRHECAAPGVGEEDVETARLRTDRSKDAIEVGGLRDVTLKRRRLRTQLARGSLELCLAPPGDEDKCALGDEASRRGKAKAAAATGDQGDLAGQFRIDRLIHGMGV